MLTRRATRARDLREAALSLPLLGPLLGDLVKLILRLLPLDERLRARELSRGWRFFLEDASFWTHVDLSKSCGVNPRFLSDSRLALALLRAACVRAKGGLQSLDNSGVAVAWPVARQEVPSVLQWAEALSVADKANLRDLVAPTSRSLYAGQVTALCRALPLCRVRCGVRCDAVEALPLLRREPPHALLTIGGLRVSNNEDGDQAFLDLASALSVCMGMEKLHFFDVPLTTRAVLDALVDAAISAGIKDMDFEECGLSQTALPALTRLMQSPGFERLSVWNDDATLFVGPAAPAFCEALRNCKSLKTLPLSRIDLWYDMAVATQLFAALEGLPALQTLGLHENEGLHDTSHKQAAGECLARLIARSSSLRDLDFTNNFIGLAGQAPIFEVLRGSHSLAVLSISQELTLEFARNVVLPAARANTSLRWLDGWNPQDDDPHLDELLLPAMEEVMDILEARRRADEEAA